MRKLLIATAAITAIAAPAAAQTFSNSYGSLGYSSVRGDDTELNGFTGRFGTRFTPNFGMEGEVSFGLGDDSIPGVPNSTVELDYDVAGYVTGVVPVSQNFELFGRVGYGKTQLRSKVFGMSSKDSDTSINWGAGANYFFDDNNGVRADWTRRDFRDNGGEADVWSVSFVRKF